MLNYNYTLRDDIFVYSLRKAVESEAFLDRAKLLITGGTATQLFLGEDTEHYRPTDDIDLVTQRFVSHKDRKKWSKGLAESIKIDGVECKKGQTETGSEVRLQGLEDEFFIRMNCFNPYYYLTYNERIRDEYDRAIDYNFAGFKVRSQHPIDIIINKVDRIVKLSKVLDIKYNPRVDKLLELLQDGKLREVDIEDTREELDEIVLHRELNIEDLGRMSQEEVQLLVQGYKARKDVYDICCVLERARRTGLEISEEQFKHSLGLAMFDLANC